MFEVNRAAIFQAAKACAAHAFDQHIPNSPSQRFWQSHADNLNAVVDAIDATTPAVRDVLAERQRQVDAEGWTPKHDDQHVSGAMSLAAACYACNAGTWAQREQSIAAERYVALSAPGFRWPWASKWWKPKSQRQDLVRAGALILAEIERIDRRATRGQICSDCGAPVDAPHNYGCMYSELDV